jgi:dipeptidyl aminopeptidase/acylaminoacyl peptidase
MSVQYSDATSSKSHVRLLIPARGSLYIQDGIDTNIGGDAAREHDSTIRCICIHDKSVTGMSATDALLSPDGSMVAWTHDGEIYVQSAQPRTLDPTLIPSIDTAALLLDDTFLAAATSTTTPAVRISFGASQTESCCITHGVADFVAQEEMDRYRGFWWHPNSQAILFTRTDESEVPIYRIMHQSNSSALPSFSSSQQHTDHSSSQHYESNGSGNGLFATSKITTNSAFEDHRYPFAGKMNPSVRLGLVLVDRDSVLELANTTKPPSKSKSKPISVCVEQRDGIDCDETTGYDQDDDDFNDTGNDPIAFHTCQDIATVNWSNCIYFDAPSGVDEYLARVHIIPDGRAIAQWQNRSQTCTILYLLDLNRPNSLDETTGNAKGQILLVERSDIWINLHHMFYLLPRPIHPNECQQSDDIGTRELVKPDPMPNTSFSFLFASEKTGFTHLYLYTFCSGVNNNEAILIRTLTSGKWTVENILGVDMEKDVVYFAGTFDSVLERHLYSIPLLNVTNKYRWRFGSYPTTSPTSSREGAAIDGTETHASSHLKLKTSDDHISQTTINGGVRGGLSKVMYALSGKVLTGGTNGNSSIRVENEEIYFTVRSENDVQCPTRLTLESGMHSVVMDEKCRYFVATSSDVDRPTTVKVYELPTTDRATIRWRATIYDASNDDAFASTSVPNEYKTNGLSDMVKCLPAPEFISFPTSDGTETLHAALYRPNPHLHGPGPYPLICAVYGGPHVQRVNRSWSQSADMRAQRLRSLGFCVVKCDNRGSSRRGLSFESAISRRLGRLEVLDQVAAVRQLVVRGIADPRRVGVYGWSYGGYLSAMCLCRAPDVFHVAVAGAPVTSWDGYDTHYTERYMGLPADNPSGYRESAVFDHVPNMRGKLMIVHGLIDENVHFRHTTRLINKLIAAGKDYDLLIFPEERHSPRRLRDRIYMEQRISEYFTRHLSFHDDKEEHAADASFISLDSTNMQGLRPMAGHL